MMNNRNNDNNRKSGNDRSNHHRGGGGGGGGGGSASGTSSAARKFCGHCKNMGKTEREYTSHNIRASFADNALVTCPELLKTECKYCHEYGHLASEKYCPALKKRVREQEYEREQHKKRERGGDARLAVTKKMGGNDMKHVSKFAILGDDGSDSDSEDEKRVKQVRISKVVEEFPALGGSSVKPKTECPTGLSFADAIKKPVVEKPVRFANAFVDGQCVVTFPKPMKKEIVTPEGISKTFSNGTYKTQWPRWADIVSSDEEDNDDDDIECMDAWDA
jgi:hypothetical protein